MALVRRTHASGGVREHNTSTLRVSRATVYCVSRELLMSELNASILERACRQRLRVLGLKHVSRLFIVRDVGVVDDLYRQ